MNRYERNQACITSDEQELLKKAKVCVIGCGGLGGYIVELLTRVGVGHITVVDGDTFNWSNLNRQLFSDMTTIGKNKAEVACIRMKQVNPEIEGKCINLFLTKENGSEIIDACDIVVDGLDSVKTRLLVGELCREKNIPLVYGAIAGWYGQVATIFPGDATLEKLYKRKFDEGKENEMGNPSFTPPLVASIQVSEVIKIITGKGELLRNKFLFINLLEQEFEVFDL